MAKRRTAAEQERIKAEVRKSMQNQPIAPELVVQRLSCGHDEAVAPGLDANHAICSQCRMASLNSQVQPLLNIRTCITVSVLPLWDVEDFGLTEYHLLAHGTRRSLCGIDVDLDGHTVATTSQELTCSQCMRLVFLEYSRPPVPAESRLFLVPA